jgi:hypothetical protein
VSIITGIAAAAAAAGGCGPFLLDSTPHVRGRIVAVAPGGVTIRHKSGRQLRLRVDPDTRVVREGSAGATLADVCAAQRAHAVLRPHAPDAVAELRITGPRCTP